MLLFINIKCNPHLFASACLSFTVYNTVIVYSTVFNGQERTEKR